ncbi:MAG: excinuclease ABC subunit UvrC [Myxococcota bacterium]
MLNEALPEQVRAKLETLPPQPGVYVFRGHAGEVLYVGKARSLRSRVRSYFLPGSSDVRAFVARLERELGDLETIVASTEKEAALLENQLIKEHQPRYNIKLRDDKEFLSLRLDPDAKWPRLQVVRRPRPDRARYFGPYHSATAARQTLRLVNRHFQLRTCTDTELKSRTRPCLQYQIKRCPGPCVFDVDRAAYGEQVRSVGLFLDGRHDELIETLEARMKAAAVALEYEQAALHRDQIRAVDRARETQRVAVVKDVDQDVVGLFRQADQAEVAVLLVRGGKLVGVRTYGFKDVSLPNDELLASFLLEWYARAPIPDEVMLPLVVEAMDGLAGVLADQRKGQGALPRTGAPGGRRLRAPRVIAPQRGAKKKLLDMAQDNARHAFEEKRRASEDIERRLATVQERLRLPTLPRRIECVDVSHTGGEETVAAVVALQNGAPDRKRYRSFHVKRVRGGDDYGAMYEVLSRRLKRGRDEDAGWELPDLLVVDGGKGQLNVALAALRDLGVRLPVAGLAKEKENALGAKVVDRVYLPGQKNAIPVHGTPALQMLALARDEAHRASNALRVKVGAKRRLRSELDDVPGVGPKTKAKLLQTFGSVDGVKAASPEALRKVASQRQVDALWRVLHGDAGEAESAAVENAFEALEG